MNPSSNSPTSSLLAGIAGTRHPRLRLTAAVVFLALLLFAPALTTDTFMGHEESLLRLPLLSHVKHVPKIFGGFFMAFTDGRYQPLSYAVLAVVRTFVPAESSLFWNLWLLAFHVLNTFLVYHVARHFAKRADASLLAAGVFLVHPLASTFGLRIELFRYVLAGTFYLGTLLAYLQYARTRRTGTFILGIVLFACGLLTSHVLLTLPILVLLYEVLYERSAVAKVALRVAPLVVLALVAVLIYALMHPNAIFYVYAEKAVRGGAWHWSYVFVSGGVDTLWALIRGASTGVPLGGFAGWMQDAWNVAFIVTGLCVCLLLAASLAAAAWRRWFFLGVFLLLLGPAATFGRPETMTSDYASWSLRYLSSLGFAFLFGAVLDVLLSLRARKVRLGVTLVATAVLVVYGAMLVVSNVHARAPKSYWEHALAENPKSEIASVELGKYHLARALEEAESGNDERARMHELLALKRLFGPPVQSLRRSSLAAARYYSRRGHHLTAVAHLGLSYRLQSYGLLDQEDVLTCVEILYNAKTLDFAEQWLGTALMTNPYNKTALMWLAEIFATKGYVSAAIKPLKAAADLDPGDVECARRLAELRGRLYHPEEKSTPTEIVPQPGDWLRYAIDQGRTERINRRLVELTDVHKDDPVIQMVVGVGLAQLGRFHEAIAPTKRAMDMMPAASFPKAAMCYVSADALARAEATPEEKASFLKLFDETIEAEGHHFVRDAEAWCRLGLLMGKLERYDEALKAYRMTLRADPELGEAQGHVGAILVRMRRYEEAIPALEKALKMKSENIPELHSSLGYALLAVDRADEALVHFREAVAFRPGLAVAYRHMAGIYQRRGRFNRCIAVLSQGLNAIPDELGLKIDLAKYLAAVPDARLRDGPRALKLADEVCSGRDATPNELDVLAAAYAENKQFARAIATASLAINKAEDAADVAQLAGREARYRTCKTIAGSIRTRRALYRRRIPYRMGRGQRPPSSPYVVCQQRVTQIPAAR